MRETPSQQYPRTSLAISFGALTLSCFLLVGAEGVLIRGATYTVWAVLGVWLFTDLLVMLVNACERQGR